MERGTKMSGLRKRAMSRSLFPSVANFGDSGRCHNYCDNDCIRYQNTAEIILSLSWLLLLCDVRMSCLHPSIDTPMIINSVVGRHEAIDGSCTPQTYIQRSPLRASRAALDRPGGCIQGLKPRVTASTCSHYSIVTSRFRIKAGASVM